MLRQKSQGQGDKEETSEYPEEQGHPRRLQASKKSTPKKSTPKESANVQDVSINDSKRAKRKKKQRKCSISFDGKMARKATNLHK